MMNRKVSVAATQMAVSKHYEQNIANAESLIEEAANLGAQIILLQELFSGYYFCKDQDAKYFSWAQSYKDSHLLSHFSSIAKQYEVVLPISYFEKDNQNFYNSLAVIDADGNILENYRKTHIPDGPGYQEKYYFTPGNSGFKVWKTKFATIGCGICWDQWFPECARSMALMGAELLFYPTAIGSEPPAPEYDSQPHWQRVMQGHAAANCMPVIASNRIGVETGESCQITFYGSSFITDATGGIVSQASRDKREVVTHCFDLQEIALQRAQWGLFRDRRPSQYGLICR